MDRVRQRGQSIVEFALVMPVLLMVLLGFGEAAFLAATQRGLQNGADVMAQWAAAAMADTPGESWQVGWSAVVADEQDRHNCDRVPSVIFPDGTHDPGDRVLVRWVCFYAPAITSNLWDGLPITVESEAVVPFVAPPVPSSSPSP